MKGRGTKKAAAGKGKGVPVASDSGETAGGDEETDQKSLHSAEEHTPTGGGGGGSLDDQLEATAAKKNLSVTNVKSILHHLVKDQRVLKLVQRLAAMEEGEGGKQEGGSHTSNDWDELTAYEPRLTRSRVREAVMSSVASGSLSADRIALLKSSSVTSSSKEKCRSVSEDGSESSDEEYNPDCSSADEEEEEEEMEADNEGEMEEIGGEMKEHNDREEVTEPQNESNTGRCDSTAGLTLFSLPTICIRSTATPTMSAAPSTAPPHSDSSPSHTHPPNTSASIDSTQATPTATQTTPTCTMTPIPRTPPRESSPSPESLIQHRQRQQQNEREIQETALLLATMAGPQNTLSPLKYLTQQPTSDLTQQMTSDLAQQPTSDPSQKPTSAGGGDGGECVVETTVGDSAEISVGGAVSAPVIIGQDLLASSSGEGVNLPRDTALSTEISASVVESLPGIESLTPSITWAEAGKSMEEKIAQRTRSKHPLHDVSITSLEAGLGPVEGEDPPTPRELDPDELWWHQWLNSLTTDPLNDSLASHVTEEEEEEDGEYNFLADCLREEEREEFRNDRAVRIPRKEVDDLITELLNPSTEVSGGRLLSDDGLDLTGAYLLETLGVQIPTLADQSSLMLAAPVLPQPNDPVPPTPSSPSSSASVLSQEQTLQLWTQIQQHFQLIIQTFVLARFEPSLVFVSQVAAQALDELSRWCSSTAENGKGVWYIPDLQDGLDLVKTLDPYNENAVKIAPSAGNPPKVPEGAQCVFMDTLLFWNYPHFLPASGFTPLTTSSASASKYFTPQEECLLVLGMEHYGPNAWEEIQTNVLPTKTLKQLKLRVKNRCSKRSGKRSGSNVIKEYKKTKKVPQISDDLPSEVPQWIVAQHKKVVGKEKEEMQKKQKQIDQVRKILINSASKIAAAREQPGSPASDSTPSVGAVGSPSDPPDSSASCSQPQLTGLATLPGGKRSSSAMAVGSGAKRPRIVASKAGQSKRGRREGRQCPVRESEVGSGQGKSGRASLENLLLAAGVEPSDPMSRFSFKFLQEVKNVVALGTYQQFIQLLQHHSQREWRPRELYRRVRELFEPWPHLVSLFTEFLSPQDCLEANALEDKHDVENVKYFISRLQEKYADAPLQLREITEKLQQLNTPSVSRQEVCESLLPLIRVHQDLAEDLKRLLFHLAPPPKFEEITLNGSMHPDDFEEVTLH